MTVKQILKIITGVDEFHIETEDEFRFYLASLVDNIIAEFGDREIVAISFYEDGCNDRVCNIEIK